MDMDMDMDMDMVHHCVHPSGRMWGGWVGGGWGNMRRCGWPRGGRARAGGRRRPKAQGEYRGSADAPVGLLSSHGGGDSGEGDIGGEGGKGGALGGEGGVGGGDKGVGNMGGEGCEGGWGGICGGAGGGVHRPHAIGHFSRMVSEYSSSGLQPLNSRRSAQVSGIVVTASTNPVYSASVQKGLAAVGGGAVGAGACGGDTRMVMLANSNICRRDA